MMPIRFIDCYTPEVRQKGYKKKDPNSTQGLEQDRVKITTVRDCRRVNVENEEAQRDEDEGDVITDGEEQSDEEASENENEEAEEQGQPTMKDLLEGWKRYANGKTAL